MTLGQEFDAFASTLAEDRQRLREARMLLHELNLGGTAIGTELNAHPDYRRHVIGALREITGIPTLSSASDLVEATSDVGPLRAAVRGAQAGRGEAVQDLQRSSAAVVGPARRLRRDQPARPPGRVLDHAGEGEPGDPRGGQPGRLRGDSVTTSPSPWPPRADSCSSTRSSRSSRTRCSRAWTTWPQRRLSWRTSASTASPPTATCCGRG